MSKKSINIFHYQQNGYYTRQSSSLQKIICFKYDLFLSRKKFVDFFKCNFVQDIVFHRLLILLFEYMKQREEKNGNLTQSFNPRYRKADFKFLQLNKRNNSTPAELRGHKSTLGYDIINSFTQINMQIGSLQEFFRARMDIHEQQILNIAHLQIKKIQMESQNLIKKYSKLIEERSLSSQLLALKYEVKFYQDKAAQIYQQNRSLKQVIKRLKSQILMMQIGEQSDHIALRNISKKYLRQKTVRKRLELSSFSNDPKQLERTNQKLLFYTSVLNPEKKVETSKKLDENHNQYKTSLKENLKIRLEKLSSNKAVRKNLKTQPSRPQYKYQQI